MNNCYSMADVAKVHLENFKILSKKTNKLTKDESWYHYRIYKGIYNFSRRYRNYAYFLYLKYIQENSELLIKMKLNLKDNDFKTFRNETYTLFYRYISPIYDKAFIGMENKENERFWW